MKYLATIEVKKKYHATIIADSKEKAYEDAKKFFTACNNDDEFELFIEELEEIKKGSAFTPTPEKTVPNANAQHERNHQ